MNQDFTIGAKHPQAPQGRTNDVADTLTGKLLHEVERIDSAAFRVGSLLDRLGAVNNGAERPQNPPTPISPSVMASIDRLHYAIDALFEQLDRAQAS